MDKGKANSVAEVNNSSGSSSIRVMDDRMVVGSGAFGDQKKIGDAAASSSSSSISVCNAEAMLRLLPMALCISALVVMLKNSEDNDYGAVSYNNLGAFRYLVHANGICAGYSLLSAVIAAMPRPSTLSRAWTFFLLDQVLTYMILAAGSVSSEVLYLSRNGDIAITWSAACVSFGSFCHKATASVVITFLALLCYVVLSLISSYKLFSRFNAPVSYPGKSIEIPPFQG